MDQQLVEQIGVAIITIASSVGAAWKVAEKKAGQTVQTDSAATEVNRVDAKLVVDGRFDELKASQEALRAEMVQRSHDLRNDMQDQLVQNEKAKGDDKADLREQLATIKGDLRRCEKDIATTKSETTQEIRRLEESIKSIHTDLKLDIKGVLAKLDQLREAN